MTAFGENIRMLASLPTGILALTSGYLSLQAATLSLDREVKLQYDLGNTVVPKWSNGTLATFTSNQTPAPVILQFDGEGRQIQPLIAPSRKRKSWTSETSAGDWTAAWRCAEMRMIAPAAPAFSPFSARLGRGLTWSDCTLTNRAAWRWIPMTSAAW